MHRGYTDFFGKLASVNIWLTFVVIRYHRLRHYPFTSGFGDDYILIYIVNRSQRCWMTSKHTILFCIGWDPTLVRRFKPCENFYRRLSLPLSSTISCGFPPLSMNLFAPRLRSFSPRSCTIQVPTTMTQLLLPPLHVRDWKAKLGTWLQRWVASHRGLFPSLFLPKIRVVETRSATLGDRIYNYRKWQRRWTPDTSFPCRCIDLDDRTTSHAHSHAVILDEFSCINADIDSDIMTASMKDQYFGDVNKLQQRFDMQQPILAELFAAHRSNVRDRADCVIPLVPWSRGFSFACSCDLPILVFHAVAQDLLHR